MRNSKLRRSVSVLLAASVLIAACGDDDDESSDDTVASASEPVDTEAEPETEPEPADTEAEEEPADTEPADTESEPEPEPEGPYPITLSQQAGEVTIAAEPETIVALDLWSLDFLDELGVAPVSAYTFGPAPSWVADAVDIEPAPLTTGALPFEEIAAAQPDLIVDMSGFFTAFDPAPLETLVEIAPTMSPPVDGLSDSWQSRFLHIAAALDRTADAEAIIADAEAQIATIETDFPALAGASISVARVNPEQTIDLIIDDSDFTRFYLNDELGFTTPAAQQEAFDSGEGEQIGGTIQVSLERAELIGADADAAIVFAQDLNSLLENPVWQSLDIVAEDRVVYVDIDTLFAVRTPSPKAIDHVFENLMPFLEAAASGEGASSVETGGGDEDAAGTGNVLDAAAAGGSTLLGNFATFSPTFNDAITGPGPVTAFMPSDAAVAAAQTSEFGAALQSDFELLDQVLSYHVADGALTAEDVIAAGEIQTLLGEPITVEVDGDTVILNGGQATVSTADLAASNGIAHVIDGILVPPSRAAEFGL